MNAKLRKSGVLRSFPLLLSITAVVMCIYALAIPTDVLSRNSWIEILVKKVEHFLPAIKGLSRHSPIQEVVRVYYTTLWSIFPFLLAWFFIADPLRTRGSPPKVRGFRLLLGALAFAVMALALMALVGLVDMQWKPYQDAATSGRGNALYIALTKYRLSMAVTSTVFFFVMCIPINMTFVLISRYFKEWR